MRNKKTILLLSFIFSPNIGGVESHLDDLCDYLIEKNYNVRVITYQPLILKTNAPAFEKHKNFEIHRISWIKNLFTTFEPYPLLQMLYLIPGILFYSIFYLLKHSREVDIIQTHGFNMAIVGYLLSTLFRKPFVVNTHVLFYFQRQSLYAKVLSYILNKAQYVLVLTQDAKKQLEYIGLEKEKVIVYHQWIDTKLFRPVSKEKARARYQLPGKAFVVLFTGRLVAAKGIPALLGAVKSFRKDKDIHFVMTGLGELAGGIQQENALNPQLHFLGKVERDELPVLYSAADICIFPSTQATKTYAEGIPRVMIEALTCGTPLIATKTGGVAEVITEDVGFFIKPTAKAITQILERLSKEKKKLSAMREKCIAHAREVFGIKQNATIIEKSFL